MRETAELRVKEKQAWRALAPDEGIRLGSGLIRKIEISTSDPRYAEIGRLQRDMLQAGEGSFFLGWEIRRRYSSTELAAAEALHLWVSAVFEPAGELTHTIYDESEACPFCGAGRHQVGELCLDVRRIPTRRPDAMTATRPAWQLGLLTLAADKTVDVGRCRTQRRTSESRRTDNLGRY